MSERGAPFSSRPLGRGDYHAAFGTGVALLALYVFTLAPTVTGEDSGELIGAAYSLGIPHPPGYPVWTMLAHLFTWLPLGDVAWRVNLFSAVCGAGTVTLLVFAGITLTGSRLAAIFGALLLGLSRVFWEQSLIAEVYTLNTLFLAGMLLLVLRGICAGRPVAFPLLSFAAGVSMGVHSTMAVLLPFWAGIAWHYMPPALRRAPAFHVRSIGLFLLGTAVYLYLPLASHFDPPVDWGDPETLQRWWDVVRREQFAFMVDQYPRSISRFAGQLAVVIAFVLRDFLVIGALLGIWGGWLLFRRNRLLALWLAGMALAVVLSSVLMQNFEQSREWHWVMRVFLLPAELIGALGIVCALAWCGGGRRGRAFVVGLAAAVAVFSLTLHAQESKRGYYYASDYARNLLATLPAGAIYVPGGDHQAFPVLYLQTVEGLRPDVTLLRKYGYLDLFSVAGLAEAGVSRWGRFPPRRHEPEILGWLLEHTDRPLVLGQEVPIAGPARSFAPLGLLVQAVRSGETPAPALPPAQLEWRAPLPDQPVNEYTLSLIQVDMAVARARMAFARVEQAAALKHLEAAAAYGHHAPEILNNLGVLCGRNGAWHAAATYFRAILEEHPEHEAARANLARVKRPAQLIQFLLAV